MNYSLQVEWFCFKTRVATLILKASTKLVNKVLEWRGDEPPLPDNMDQILKTAEKYVGQVKATKSKTGRMN